MQIGLFHQCPEHGETVSVIHLTLRYRYISSYGCFLLSRCSQLLSPDPAIFMEGQPQRMEPQLNGQEPLSMTFFFFVCFCLSVHPS